MIDSVTELLAPAGDFETALAAFAAGADAVYCGLSDFSARAFAKNFTPEELKRLLAVARAQSRKVYVTFNTLIDEDNFESAIEQIAALAEIGPDGVIVQDLGVARLCRKHFPQLVLHASTQMVAHNLEGVIALRDLDFKRVVLARELSLAEIASIAKRCGDLELEVFVHGALCYSLSGLCLFGAMEKSRSGNRGQCPYCCRQAYPQADGKSAYPFSMKDLRLGESVRELVASGVASLKIEGRMKSPLYVASVTRHYRDLLDGSRQRVSLADLETVFSRRTTKLYFDGQADSPVDPESLGHLGTEIGTVKRVTKDRDGISWLRFHTARGLEKHDGLQFEAMAEGRHLGMGVVEMRQAISRRPVFEVNAGTDVEVRLPDDNAELAAALRPGTKIYCSMSNAVKRMFPTPTYRPSDYPGNVAVDLEVTLAANGIAVRVLSPVALEFREDAELSAAQHPDRTFAAVEKAFSKLGETDYRLGLLKVNDPDRSFVPISLLNDLRRELVEKLDDLRARERRRSIELAEAEDLSGPGTAAEKVRRVKLRPDQPLPPGDFAEVIVRLDDDAELPETLRALPLRLSLPVYTPESEFNRLRNRVKRYLRAGFRKWEATDLATLRMLKALGVEDLTADWSLYAFNARALKELSEQGVRRFVASPENHRENLQYLAESGYEVEFLTQQSTPLFISLTRPAAESALAIYERGGLWITTRPAPRTFATPDKVSTRLDLSWDLPC